MGKVILLTSGKGGTGVTTLTAGLAAGLAASGRRVLAAELHPGYRNLDLALGEENSILYHMSDLLHGSCGADMAVYPVAAREGLWYLPCSQKEADAADDPTPLIEALKDRFDWILIDADRRWADMDADLTVFVTTPERASVRNTDMLRSRLGLRPERQAMIINRIRMKRIREGAVMSLEEIRDLLPVDIIGLVPEKKQGAAAMEEGRLLTDEKTRIGQAVLNICRRLEKINADKTVPVEKIQAAEL